MGDPKSTCWSLIHAVRRGEEAARSDFAARYLPVIAAYLRARWAGSSLSEAVDDATQEAFLDLLREGGALTRLDPTRPGGFRAFLYGVVRNVARHVETRRGRARARGIAGGVDLDAVAGREGDAAHAFDQAWAVALVREAFALHRERALAGDESAVRRTEILRLHVGDGVPLRDLARQWGVDPERLYREHGRARQELREALLEVVALHHPGDAPGAERSLEELLAHFEVPDRAEPGEFRGPEAATDGAPAWTATRPGPETGPPTP